MRATLAHALTPSHPRSPRGRSARRTTVPLRTPPPDARAQPPLRRAPAQPDAGRRRDARAASCSPRSASPKRKARPTAMEARHRASAPPRQSRVPRAARERGRARGRGCAAAGDGRIDEDASGDRSAQRQARSVFALSEIAVTELRAQWSYLTAPARAIADVLMPDSSTSTKAASSLLD